MVTSKLPPRFTLMSRNKMGMRVSIAALVPRHSPAMTFIVLLPSERNQNNTNKEEKKKKSKCWIPNIERGSFWQARNVSLARKGPALFNCLPKSLRNCLNCCTDSFKVKLDKWLTNIPDESQIPGYTGMRRRETNCITDMQSIDGKYSETFPKQAWIHFSYLIIYLYL